MSSPDTAHLYAFAAAIVRAIDAFEAQGVLS